MKRKILKKSILFLILLTVSNLCYSNEDLDKIYKDSQDNEIKILQLLELAMKEVV